MEGNIVLSDELEQFHLVGILPPGIHKRPPVQPPVFAQVAGHGDIADGRVEPDVEDLVLIARLGHGNAPFQVPGDGPFPQSVPDPGLGHLDGVVGPEALDRSVLHPGFQPILDLGQVDVEVIGFFGVRRMAAGRTAGLFQFRRIQQFAAGFALIAPGSGVAAVRADAPHVAVRQKTVAGIAEQLLVGALHDVAVGVQLLENILHHRSVDGRGRPAPLIEGDIEPLVDPGMQGVVSVAQLLRADALFGGLGFRGGAVFVGPADIQGFIPLETAETGKNIRREHLDQVAEVGDIIDIGKG